MTATSQHTENREDPGAGEDSPPLRCGALRAFFPPRPQPWVIETRAQRDRGVVDRRLEQCRWGGLHPGGVSGSERTRLGDNVRGERAIQGWRKGTSAGVRTPLRESVR